MSRMIGTVSRGVRAPIIRQGDDIVEIVTASVLEAAADGGYEFRDKDVVAMTEAIVARAQGNYASVDDIATDVKAKFGEGATVGVIFPILSRNRFAICLRGIAKGASKIVLMLSYPSDEVGNHLVSFDALDEKGVDPYRDVLSLEKYRELFGYGKHRFTGVDYVEYLYIFAGVAVSEGVFRKLTTRTVGWLTGICFTLTCAYQLWLYSTPANHLLMEPSPSILITSTLCLKLIRRIAPRFEGWKKGITYLSKIAFGIYFVHILIMSAMYWYLDLNAVARPLRVIFFEAVSFIGSIAVIWALAKIPVCKKYLFLIKG